jgi:hypothetical protein
MTTLDPQIAAELEELEALFAEDVRAIAEPMPLSLKSRLERDVAAGFPGKRKQRRPFGLPTWALPAMGTAAAVLIAVVVVAGSRSGGEDSTLAQRTPTSSEAGRTATAGTLSAGSTAADELTPATTAPAAPLQKQAAPAPSAQADSAAGAGGASEAAPKRGFERKVQRAVDLDLRVGAGKLEDAADGVVRVTQQLGGYVSDSQVAARDKRGEAYFTLRIPTARLDEATKRLSRLGHVSRLDQSSRDITGAFVSAADRLNDARAERKALLRALAKAKSAGQIASLRQRISLNRSEIAGYKGQLESLRRKADLATIAVQIVATGKASTVTPGGGDWSPDDAAGDALRLLEVAAGVLLIVLAAMVPLALLGGLAYLAGRGARRRRREGALDAV